MKQIYSSLLTLLVLTPFFLAPVAIMAQAVVTSPDNKEVNGELIPCGNDYNGDHIVKDGEQCGFTDLIKLVNNVINWLITISTLIATGVAAYAGVLLLTSGGKPEAMKKAKAMLGKVVTGYVIILIAWLAVYTIMHTLVDSKQSEDLIGAFKK